MRCAWPQLVLAPIPYVRILTRGGNTLANLSAVKQLKRERELVQHQLFGLTRHLRLLRGSSGATPELNLAAKMSAKGRVSCLQHRLALTAEWSAAEIRSVVNTVYLLRQTGFGGVVH